VTRIDPDRLAGILADVDKATATGSEQSQQLPPEVYTDPEFFDWEREAIWFRSWVCVGRADQVPEPGDYYSIDLMGEPLLVLRDRDGQVQVLSAVCPHRGNTVATGEGNCGHALRCAYHFWSFDLDGRLIGAPEMRDVVDIEVLRGDTRLPAASVEIWHGFILANFDPAAEPVGPTLAAADSELAAYGVGTMRSTRPVKIPDMPWNWKILQENFMEAYHLTYLHQGSHDFAPSDLTSVQEFIDGENVIIRSAGFLKMDGSLTRDGWGWPAVFPILDGLSDEQRTRVLWVAILPNMFIGLCPDMVLSYMMVPKAADRMELWTSYLLPPDRFDDPLIEEKCAELTAGSTTVVNQDVMVNTAVQVNLRSRFTPTGRLSSKERILGMFHRWLAGRYRSYTPLDLVPADPEPPGS
jgi:phenylpropionate dioxygenase-like ring-hydroxylating dioxygenase large terminal subunit